LVGPKRKKHKIISFCSRENTEIQMNKRNNKYVFEKINRTQMILLHFILSVQAVAYQN
jgi:hypothetical protein